MQIDDQMVHVREAHDRDAQADGRVEGTARDRPDGERADHDREADRQAVERVARRPLGGRRVEHDIDQGEREEELAEEPGRQVVGDRVGRRRRRPRRRPLDEEHAAAAATAAANWATQYGMASAQVHLPRSVTPSVTAGL